jgi:hypothetical protein
MRQWLNPNANLSLRKRKGNKNIIEKNREMDGKREKGRDGAAIACTCTFEIMFVMDKSNFVIGKKRSIGSHARMVDFYWLMRKICLRVEVEIEIETGTRGDTRRKVRGSVREGDWSRGLRIDGR